MRIGVGAATIYVTANTLPTGLIATPSATTHAPPSMPCNFSATADGRNAIDLSWQAPALP